jgi:hypothetical protein
MQIIGDACHFDSPKQTEVLDHSAGKDHYDTPYIDAESEINTKLSLLMTTIEGISDKIGAITNAYDKECEEVVDSYVRSLNEALIAEEFHRRDRHGEEGISGLIQNAQLEMEHLMMTASELESECERLVTVAESHRRVYRSNRSRIAYLTERIKQQKREYAQLKERLVNLQTTPQSVVCCGSTHSSETVSLRRVMMKRITQAGRDVRQAEARLRRARCVATEEDLLERLQRLMAD